MIHRVGALVAVVVLGFVAPVVGVGGDAAQAATPAQAGSSTAVVIVDTGAGVHQAVIHFDGSVSGLEALARAGADPKTIGYGALGQAVCKLFGVGDAEVPSQCPGGWVYYRAAGGAGGWTQSSLGASNTTVRDGDVEGWKYGGGQPPFASYCAVVGCAPPPTDPPPITAPPVTNPTPPAGDAAVPPAAVGTTPTPSTSSPEAGTSGGKRDSRSADDAAARGAPGSAAGAAADDNDEAGGGSGSGASQQRAGVALAAGTDSGGDSGSPIGMIVAIAVVALGAGTGLWLRRRRQGPAPG